MLFVKGYNKWFLIGTIKSIHERNDTDLDLFIFEQKLRNTHFGGYFRLGPYRTHNGCEYRLVCPD